MSEILPKNTVVIHSSSKERQLHESFWIKNHWINQEIPCSWCCIVKSLFNEWIFIQLTRYVLVQWMKIPLLSKDFPVQHREHGISWLIQWFFIQSAFFQLCFDSGKIPTLWTQSVIIPIPKSRLSDPHVPLNYRGISLLSCVYKLYSAILNNRLAIFLGVNDILHDEQNGFRAWWTFMLRSYQLYSL